MINLDTNVLLAFLEDRARTDEIRLIERNAWLISDAVLWEIGLLERAERIRPLLGSRAFDEILARTTVIAVDTPVARALRRLDFRSDPADEIIAATSIVHEVPLLTRDTRILSSKVVPLALS